MGVNVQVEWVEQLEIGDKIVKERRGGVFARPNVLNTGTVVMFRVNRKSFGDFLGFGVRGSGFGVRGSGFGVRGSGFGLRASGFGQEITPGRVNGGARRAE